jgi:hypothetical protein
MSLTKVTRSDTDNLTTPANEYCRRLEGGDIVFFDHIPFALPAEDIDFLLSARQENTRLHKNISYRPGQDILRGFSGEKEDADMLRSVMQNYSATVVRFVRDLLAPYADGWSLDYASYRPIEESGRELPLHKRNDLLHVDAFPSRPTGGGRILRFFNNINPVEARVWEIGERFEKVAAEFAASAGLDDVNSTGSKIIARAARTLCNLGVPLLPDRSQYDRFMLRFHDYLKENTEYQSRPTRTRIEFPPNSTWIVFTDCVPHSVLSGQFALEQTFIIPYRSLVAPETSPASILERLAGRSLTGG